MNNFYYFEYSLQHDDSIMDFSNPRGIMVISPQKGRNETDLQIANKKLVDLITTYKTLKDLNSDKNFIKKIVVEIIELVENTRFINYSAFCVYFQVLKYSYSAYKDQKENMSLDDKVLLFSSILDNYLSNRHEIYSSYGYTDQSLQIMSDCASSRRNGKTGIEKIEGIIVPLGFKKAKKVEDMKNSKVYLLPDKDGKSLFNTYLEQEKIDFVFRKKRDNKNPDVLLKYNDNIFILEHKLTNGDGGSQNAELNEIISFIGQTESNKKVHYISCLQGNFIKKLRDVRQPKNVAQLDNIKKNLEVNKGNFFVNGKGFEQLIKDIVIS